MATHYFPCPCLTTLGNIQYSQHHTHSRSTRSSLVTKGLQYNIFLSKHVLLWVSIHSGQHIFCWKMCFTGESLYNSAVLYLHKYGIVKTVDDIRMDSDIITFIVFVYKQFL
jgi:hypothetical protein